MDHSGIPYVGVVGPGEGADEAHLAQAEQVGRLLAGAGAVLVNGGHGGVMRAAAAGCRAAGGTSIAILPDRDRTRANAESTFAVPTGMGELRNGLVVRASDAVICVALSWGTLSEVALAMRTGVPVVVLGRWPGPLAGPLEAAIPDEAVRLALDAARNRSADAAGAPTSGAAQGAGAPAGRPPGPTAGLVHHVTLTVTDVQRSAAWYQALLGPARVVPRQGPGWTRLRMEWPNGLIIGVTGHSDTPASDRFDHRRVGLDHVGLACASADEVQAWAMRLDELGAPRGPVEDVPYAWAVTGRDPDGIPVEFFAPK